MSGSTAKYRVKDNLSFGGSRREAQLQQLSCPASTVNDVAIKAVAVKLAAAASK